MNSMTPKQGRSYPAGIDFYVPWDGKLRYIRVLHVDHLDPSNSVVTFIKQGEDLEEIKTVSMKKFYKKYLRYGIPIEFISSTGGLWNYYNQD